MTMLPRVYTSYLPSVPMYQRSIFTHMFFSSDPGTVGGHPASNPAFIDAATGTTITRQQLKHFALSFGYGLLTHPGLVQLGGDTVLIYSPNSIAYPVVLLGTVAAGLKCSPANSAYTSRELEHQYTDSGATVIVTSEEGLPVVWEMFQMLGIDREEAVKRVVVIEAGLSWARGPSVLASPALKGLLKFQELLSLGTLKQERLFNGSMAHRTCYICYSSGTTGKPKGVETTHANLTTVVDIGRPVLFKHGNQDRLLGILPFFHIYGAVALLHAPFLSGATVIVQNRFAAEQFCENIEKYKITIAMVVPPVLVVLARHAAVDKYDLSSLKIAFSAAAPLGTALIHQVTERFRLKGTDIAVTQGYGLTETSPITHILPPSFARQKAGSIGILLSNLEARIVVDGNGDGIVDAADDHPGELWIRGPTIMKGYLNNTKATLESITHDGWFKSGDICKRDVDGYFWIVDRRKELIKYKGFQVPPSELESILLSHPDIADVAVIGVDDLAEATELPRAYVVHADSEQITTAAAKDVFAQHIRKWMESQVANHKFLRGGVSIIDEIPKSAAGKILRRELRERAKLEFPVPSKL